MHSENLRIDPESMYRPSPSALHTCLIQLFNVATAVFLTHKLVMIQWQINTPHLSPS